MLVRTLSIKHDEQNVLTAALLFGFAIPELNRNFLAYSLNEDVDDTNSRVYLVSLHKKADGFSLHALTSDADWQGAAQAFRQILREAVTGETGMPHASFYLLDLGEQTVTSAVINEHRTLNVAKDWIVKLFNFQPSASLGPALETAVPAKPGETETHPEQLGPKPNFHGPADASSSDLASFNHDTETQESGDDESVFQGLGAESFLTEVQTTLDDFSELAEKLTAQESQRQIQQETLASRELQLQDRELLFNQKKEALLQDLKNYSEQQLQQNTRQSELDLREKALQRKAMELSINLKKLGEAKNKLSIILKALPFDSSKT
ncbi:hypothetical protein GNF76_04820 [Pseudomonas sp. CCM 7893]|uniref:Uncharacterized protein n=1 Tax=Pseudomonas spelaei TaxID=1055469 RepID=A0A6I3W877_9PSED|nr:hypothetical protein [Pseudomonas spelaei]MUF03643.1 hypothetical protein [Pseudomonas spelaei]